MAIKKKNVPMVRQIATTRENFLDWCKDRPEKKLYKIPGELYLSEDKHLIMVTSDEWVNYITGGAAKIPASSEFEITDDSSLEQKKSFDSIQNEIE